MRILWTGLTAAVALWLLVQLVAQAPQYASGSLGFGELLMAVIAAVAAAGSAVGAPVIVWRGLAERVRVAA